MDDSGTAWQRAQLILEAHGRLAEGEHHLYDVPGYSIERLLADLMHYAHERNKGKPLESGEYLEFDRLVASAKQQFVAEREATVERHEPLLDPELQALRQARANPEFRKVEQDLLQRQFEESIALIDKQRKEADRLGSSPELEFRHRQEDADQENRFREEKNRYASEFLESQRLAREIEEREKQESLGLDKDSKLSK